VAEVIGEGSRRRLVGQEDDRLLTLLLGEELGRLHVLGRLPLGLQWEPVFFAEDAAVELKDGELSPWAFLDSRCREGLSPSRYDS